MSNAPAYPLPCCSGRHRWMDPTSSARCCHPKWKRAVRHLREQGDLDEEGRVYTNYCFVFGWVYIEDKHATDGSIER